MLAGRIIVNSVLDQLGMSDDKMLEESILAKSRRIMDKFLNGSCLGQIKLISSCRAAISYNYCNNNYIYACKFSKHIIFMGDWSAFTGELKDNMREWQDGQLAKHVRRSLPLMDITAHL